MFSGKICPLYITDWVSVNRHHKECTNKPLLQEKKSLVNHINANFVLKTPFRGKFYACGFQCIE